MAKTGPGSSLELSREISLNDQLASASETSAAAMTSRLRAREASADADDELSGDVANSSLLRECRCSGTAASSGERLRCSAVYREERGLWGKVDS
jgi:hypothetical protein